MFNSIFYGEDFLCSPLPSFFLFIFMENQQLLTHPLYSKSIVGVFEVHFLHLENCLHKSFAEKRKSACRFRLSLNEYLSMVLAIMIDLSWRVF